MKDYRIMIEIFENFIIHYVDPKERAFAYNNAFSEINIGLRAGKISSDETGIISRSIGDFMTDYDNIFNFFHRDQIICMHLKEFKDKIGRIELNESHLYKAQR